MTIRFTLDGRAVAAREGETIWEVAHREGTTIPHLCHRPEPGYRPDGNCRACMVEIEGERVLAASCIRPSAEGMVVRTASERARTARKLVMELLVADQPPRELAHDAASPLWRFADAQGVTYARFPGRDRPAAPDLSHPAMAVNLDACISCTLCARACREVQVNDVIGMAYRGDHHRPVFDLDDPMGVSTCVACGECVQACPTGALMPASIVDRETQVGTRGADETVDSVCPYCGVGCQISYKLRDGKIAYVEGRDGPANESRLCVKGRFGFDYVASPQRLTVPLIRRAGAPKGLNVDPANPLTHFREATWEEALDAAAGGLARIRDAHGGRAIAGFGSAKGSNEEAYLVQKLIRQAFGHNNVDHCTRLCHASSVAALMEGIGSGAVTAPFNDALLADVVVVIGANPTENHPVAATYFKQAVKRGAKLVVMDPRGNTLMMRHATHRLRFRPGSDVALLNAMMHVIVTENLVDHAYVATHTEGYARLAEHLAAYAPEAMAERCGVDAGTIREVARLYARADRAMIFWGMGVSQHTHGTDNARCLISLALMTGQVGRPGTGLHPLRGQNNVQGASDAGLIPMVLPDYARVGDPAQRARFEAAWGFTVSPQPGLTVTEIMDSIHAGDIRALYVMGENPAMSDPDVAHARDALAELEHCVVQDIFLTETAMYADVVLPASAWPEKTGTVTNTNRQVQMGRPALPPPGQAREDLAILVDLGRRLGLPWDYAHPREVFAEMAAVMPSLANITWERLEREGAVTYPCPAPDAPGHAVVFGDAFPRAGGRALFVPAGLRDPDETPDDAFPMVLTTGRQLEHWHTGAMTRRAGILDALEPAPTASLNPRTLARLGLAAGAPIRVETRRGAITLAARADAALQEDMVFVPFAYVEAAANLLTNPAIDPDGKIPEFKYCAARVVAG
ncbi:formate dehydrogenase subunit alpha [Salinarimonas chemoclinalis]|uniref:formate dehydrogenase subunit alpha n=1 Tax=Salinarimonas chemoclinalis TaxID=3241599 RepID=UPI0035590AA6